MIPERTAAVLMVMVMVVAEEHADDSPRSVILVLHSSRKCT